MLTLSPGILGYPNSRDLARNPVASEGVSLLSVPQVENFAWATDLLVYRDRYIPSPKSERAVASSDVDRSREIDFWKEEARRQEKQMNGAIKTYQSMLEILKSDQPLPSTLSSTITPMLLGIERTAPVWAKFAEAMSRMDGYRSVKPFSSPTLRTTIGLLGIDGMLKGSKSTFTSALILKEKDGIDQAMYKELEPFKRLTVLLPRVYHALRILRVMNELSHAYEGRDNAREVSMSWNEMKTDMDSLRVLYTPHILGGKIKVRDAVSLQSALLTLANSLWGRSSLSKREMSAAQGLLSKSMRPAQDMTTDLVKGMKDELIKTRELLNSFYPSTSRTFRSMSF